MSEERRISNRQMQVLSLVDSLGILLVTLPLGTAIISGASGWTFVLFGGILTAVIMAMAVSCDSLYEWLVDKKLGNIVGFLLCGKMIYCGGIWLRYFSETINQLLLPKTSTWLISLLFLIVAVYAACKGIEARGRFAEIVIVIIFFVLVFIFALSAQNIKFENFQPYDIMQGGNAILYTVSAFFGIEYLFLASPYINGKKKGKNAFIVGCITALILSGATAFAVGVFGVEGVTERRWAVLQIMDTIDFPLMLLERQDVLMMGFWITSMFAFINGAAFYSGNVLSRIIAKRDRFVPMFIVVAMLIFFVSLAQDNIVSVTEVINNAMILNLITEGFVILVFIFGRRRRI